MVLRQNIAPYDLSAFFKIYFYRNYDCCNLNAEIRPKNQNNHKNLNGWHLSFMSLIFEKQLNHARR